MENIEENNNPINKEFINGENIDDSNENTKPIHNELIDGENPANEGHRSEENIEKNSSSNVSSLFDKKPTRTNRSFGAGHEPGTMPGGGV